MIKKLLKFKYKEKNGCWECVSHQTDKGGYPRCMGYDKKNMTVHRYVFYNLISKKISKLVIRHICDNRLCINPKHLLSGTISDNMKDRDLRGRTSRIARTNGEINGMSKLTKDKILEIRKLKSNLKSKEIAKKFNISVSHTNSILGNRFWKHVGGAF